MYIYIYHIYIYTIICLFVKYISFKHRGLISSQFSHLALEFLPRLQTPWRRAEVHGCWDRVQARSAAAHAAAPPNTQHCPPRRRRRMEWSAWNKMEHGHRLIIVGILPVPKIYDVRVQHNMILRRNARRYDAYVICSCGYVSRVASWSPFGSMHVLWASVASVENWYSTRLPLRESDLIGPEEGVAHCFQRSQDCSEALNLRATGCMDWACQNPGLVANLTSDLTTAKNITGWEIELTVSGIWSFIESNFMYSIPSHTSMCMHLPFLPIYQLEHCAFHAECFYGLSYQTHTKECH